MDGAPTSFLLVIRVPSRLREQFPGALELRSERELKLHTQEGQPFQIVGVGERSGVNRAQATRLDQLGDRRLRCGVIPSDEDIQGLAGHLALDQRPG